MNYHFKSTQSQAPNSASSKNIECENQRNYPPFVNVPPFVNAPPYQQQGHGQGQGRQHVSLHTVSNNGSCAFSKNTVQHGNIQCHEWKRTDAHRYRNNHNSDFINQQMAPQIQYGQEQLRNPQQTVGLQSHSVHSHGLKIQFSKPHDIPFQDSYSHYKECEITKPIQEIGSQNFNFIPVQKGEDSHIKNIFTDDRIQFTNSKSISSMMQHQPKYPPVPIVCEAPIQCSSNIGNNARKNDQQHHQNENLLVADKTQEANKSFKRKKKDLGSVKIIDGQQQMRNLIVTMATLKHQLSALEKCLTNGSSEEWKTEFLKTENLKKSFLQLQNNLSDDVNKLQARVEKQKRKRIRLKRLKNKNFEEKQSDLIEREIRETKIDKWRESVTQKMLDVKQKVEMKKMADKTLSEVRSKISDTTRKLNLLKGLQRLRKIRMEAAARIGRYTPGDNDTVFESNISQAYNILTTQREIYEGEEKTLKVLLEAEQEETQELVKQRQKEIKEQKERSRKKQRNEMLFGKSAELEPSDPMYSFYQYYDQGRQNFQSFLEIRHNWDYWIVPDSVAGSTRLPDEWVLPLEPSNDSWTKYLKH